MPLLKTLEPDQAKLKVIEGSESGQDFGFVEGYASVFNNVDLGGEVVVKGAFAKSLKERLKKGMIKLYDSHMVYAGSETVIGLVEDAKEDEYGLWFRARFSSVQRAQDVRTKIREGVLNALSFGYEVIKDDVDEAKKVRYLKELRIYEISVVPWGMNPKAMIEAVKGSGYELAPETAAAMEGLEIEQQKEGQEMPKEEPKSTPLPAQEDPKDPLEQAAKDSPIAAAVKAYRDEVKILSLRYALGKQARELAALRK